MTPRTNPAVMAQRHEPPDSLDFFPTPPWATRALVLHILQGVLGIETQRRRCWEPAAGEGHMVGPLREAFGLVFGSDIHDYGRGFAVGDFTAQLGGIDPPWQPDWIITNPPFNHALDFARRATSAAAEGVALLVRTAWLEGGERYETLFSRRPPAVVAQFVERVAMVRGRWAPSAASATAYAWVVWRQDGVPQPTRFVWIPPGRRDALTRPEDVQRFAGLGDGADGAGPLFGGAA